MSAPSAQCTKSLWPFCVWLGAGAQSLLASLPNELQLLVWLVQWNSSNNNGTYRLRLVPIYFAFIVMMVPKSVARTGLRWHAVMLHMQNRSRIGSRWLRLFILIISFICKSKFKCVVVVGHAHNKWSAFLLHAHAFKHTQLWWPWRNRCIQEHTKNEIVRCDREQWGKRRESELPFWPLLCWRLRKEQ